MAQHRNTYVPIPSPSDGRWAEDLGSLVGLDGAFSAVSSAPGSSAAIASGASASSTVPSPLQLPAAYEEAKEQKVQSVANLRAAVKSVRPGAQPGSRTDHYEAVHWDCM